MYRRILLASALAGTLALGLAIAPAASARDSWSVSIGAPGFAVSAGSPVYYGRPYYRPYYRPYWRPAYVPAPVYYYPAPVYRPYVYGGPVVTYRHW